jgi:hypothetical protein
MARKAWSWNFLLYYLKNKDKFRKKGPGTGID